MAMYKYISVIIPFGQLTSLGSQSSTGAAVPACEIIVINSELSIDSFEKKNPRLTSTRQKSSRMDPTILLIFYYL